MAIILEGAMKYKMEVESVEAEGVIAEAVITECVIYLLCQ